MASGMTLDEQMGRTLPTTVKSREDMLPHIPAALRTLRRMDAGDLVEMILGEDA